MATEKTYEMLWDCKYCGQKKNLGKTHRHCPNCGGEQDATLRYFPSDEEKVAVEDHAYVGADVHCPACRQVSSRAARCCGACGSPLEGAKDAARRADQLVEQGQVYAGETALAAKQELQGYVPATAPATSATTAAPDKKKKLAFGCGCLTLLALIAAVVMVLTLWRKDSTAHVKALTWERTIDVEVYAQQRRSAWCSELPTGAKELRRTREARGTERVEDGEDCRTRKVDNGDGTFKETEECTPRYKQVDKLEDKCDYEILDWGTARTERALGAAREPAPSWPQVVLTKPGTCQGCEREGKRKESYEAVLQDAGGKEHRCSLPEAPWSALRVGQALAVRASVVTGAIDCDSIGRSSQP